MDTSGQTNHPNDHQQARAKGARAEGVASWYFRLNGFLSIPGFVVHLDSPYADPRHNGPPRYARTEADLLAVRFPYSREVIAGREMIDDEVLIRPSTTGRTRRTMFSLVEVKAGRCRMNGPWTNSRDLNMQRVVRRLGVAHDEQEVEEISSALYSSARWESATAVLQYVCVGGQKDDRLWSRYAKLVQIDWREIGAFLFRRFNTFPEKLPGGHVHSQWPSFGRKYGDWFVSAGRWGTAEDSGLAVQQFVEIGSLQDGA